MSGRFEREEPTPAPPGRGTIQARQPGGVFQPKRATPGGATGGLTGRKEEEAILRYDEMESWALERASEITDCWSRYWGTERCRPALCRSACFCEQLEQEYEKRVMARLDPDRLMLDGSGIVRKVPPSLEEAIWRINRFIDGLDELIDIWFSDVKDPEVLKWIKSAPELKERLIDRIMKVITMG